MWFFIEVGIKHPILSLNLSCLIKLCSSHHSFALSCATIDLFFTPFSIQPINHSLFPPFILTNHTSPTNSPYQPPTLHVNVEPQPHTFPNPLNHSQVGPFPLSNHLTPIVTHNQTPQLTFIFSIVSQPSSKVFCPTCGHQFIGQRLACHQHSCQASNSLNPNHYDHPSLIHFLVPTLFA
jgi:hypothetical protein